MTPPEPVVWTSLFSAFIIVTSKALSPLLKWGRWHIAFPARGFCSVSSCLTITLGWTSLFPSPKNKSNFSPPAKVYQFLALLLFSLILTFIKSPNATAESAASTAPTRLIIPSISFDNAVVPVGWKEVTINGQTYPQWEVDKNLVGWHNLSAPLGQVGNSVLNGHSNVYGQVFRNLDQVKVGDSIVAVANDQVYSYIVVSKLLVQEKGVSVEKRLENAKLIMPTSDERLTLVTCAQAGATHRLIIVAYRENS